ncbi:MAG: PTS transporter subunit EIIB, partial [Anaerococcus sp.]|nr:PTS transporter subunit EIIB [Anaerococcus sp.]
GITEPIEFTFIFLSPILWIANSILTGLSFLIPYLLGVTIGNIQGGVIDWLVFGVLQGLQTKWYIYLVAGPIFFALYFFVYSFIIKKFNVNTIGRNEEMKATKNDKSSSLKAEDEEVAKTIVDGLGGVDNISDVDNCISRLRVVVKNPELINEDLIYKTDQWE